MQSAKRAILGGLLVPIIVIGLVGCGTSATPDTAPTPSSTEPVPPSPLPTASVTPPPGITPQQTESKEKVEIGIRRQGLAVSKSDVSDIPDSELTAGEVVFVPEEQAVGLADTAGFDRSDIEGMRHALFRLDESRLADLDGAAAAIGADGRFVFDIPNGRYFVCLADSFADHTTGPPYMVVGCDVIDLVNDAPLTVSFGEAGVEATLQ